MEQYLHQLLQYIDKAQRDRIQTLIKSKKGFAKFQDMLSHKIKLNKKLSRQLKPEEQQYNHIYKLLSSKSPDADFFIVSEDNNINGMIIPLNQALDNIYTSGYATIMISLDGRLGYYETEGKNSRYLLSTE